MNRRDFLRTAGGAAGGTAAASAGVVGPAAAAEGGGGGESGGGGGGTPDFGGWLSDVPNYDSVQDARGQGEVSVSVGAPANNNLSFAPAAVHVDNGATVVWEWTGEGGSHNVIDEGGSFESELTGEAGATFEHTFEEDGIYNYYCEPHRSAGMKGSIVVGTDYPSIAAGVRTEQGPEHMGVPFQPHMVGIATLLAMMITLVFTFFTLKYGESAHTKGGNN